MTPPDLTPASGVRTTRLRRPLRYHSSALTRLILKRPPHPAPNVRDDREAPLLWEQDGGSCRSDLGLRRSKIFFAEGLDRNLVICPSGSGEQDAARVPNDGNPYSAAAFRGRPTNPVVSPKRSTITAGRSLALF